MSIYEPRPNGFQRMSPAVDLSRCRAQVYEQVSRNFSQCARRASVQEEGLGFCKQHAPSAERARMAASAERDRRQREARTRPFQMLTAYGEALRAIADGHNDPRQLAAETLARFGPAQPSSPKDSTP